MRRFRFRMAGLLRIKEQRQRQAELEQKKAALELEQSRTERATLGERLAQAAAGLGRQVGQPVPPDLWIARYHHAAQIGRALESAEQRERRAAQAMHQADQKRARIASEVEALVHLRKVARSAHRTQAARIDQQALDEQGLGRWHRARGAGAPEQGEGA